MTDYTRPDPARGPHLRMASGRVWHFLDPDPGAVLLADIAHHLARKLRFSGALDVSVAQHSVLVSRAVESLARQHGRPRDWVRDAALTGLLHDAEEGPLVDLVTPLKARIREWPVIERRNRDAIFAGLGVRQAGWDLVHQVDVRIREDEVRCCAAPAFRGAWIAGQENTEAVPPLGLVIAPWPAPRAAREFVARYERLRLAVAP